MSGIQGMDGSSPFFLNNKWRHHDITTIVKIVDQC